MEVGGVPVGDGENVGMEEPTGVGACVGDAVNVGVALGVGVGGGVGVAGVGVGAGTDILLIIELMIASLLGAKREKTSR